MKPGDWVLIEGTGGVAIIALQLAKAMGRKVVILSSSKEKIARARALGAEDAINYRTTPEWSDAVRKATGGQGVNIVVESAGSTLGQAIKTVAPGGVVAIVGFLGGFETQIPIVPMIASILTVKGIAGSRDQFEALNRAIEATNVQSISSRRAKRWKTTKTIMEPEDPADLWKNEEPE